MVITDEAGQPRLVLDADGLLRTALFESGRCDPDRFCHRPVIVSDEAVALGDVLRQLRVTPQAPDDDVIDKDIILVWADRKRIITGADILGRLLRGIVARGD